MLHFHRSIGIKNQVFRLLIFLLTVTLLLGGRGNAIALPLLPEQLAVIDRATATGGTVVEPVKKKNEVSCNLLKKHKLDEEQLFQLIVSFYRKYQVISFNLDIFESASNLRTQYHLSFWDSLVITCA